MLRNFFKLNSGANAIQNQIDLENFYNQNDTITNLIYYPDELKGNSTISKLKITNKTFENVSFKDTLIKDVEFTNCHFFDCLFLGAKIEHCKFLECSFKGCNTYGINIENSYLNPVFFKSNFKFNHYTKSNIALQLFQELYNNAIHQDLVNFTKKAKYYQAVWEDKSLISKYFFKKPYAINGIKFYPNYTLNQLYKYCFGYGLQLRNFLISFIVIFIGCFFLNKIFWSQYELHEKDFAIQYFNSTDYSNYANLYYTTDVLTKAIDSQFQPCSNFGMFFYLLQGSIGIIYFSLLVTVLINKFVK